VISARALAAAITAAGAAATVSYLWFLALALPLAGAFLAGIGISWLRAIRGRSTGQREQDEVIRQMWLAVGRMAPGRVLEDPLTGCGLAVERPRAILVPRGFVTLTVCDPVVSGGPAERREATVTSYMLGSPAAPSRAPLFRHTTPLFENSPDRISLRQASGLLRFNSQTGAMGTTPAELAELRAQLERVIATAGGG
jgi:hypothetical protein